MSLEKFGFTNTKQFGNSAHDRYKRKRSFQPGWKNTCPWVDYDESEGEMFCTWCRDHPGLADKSNALFKGCANLKTDPLRSHEKSNSHQSCAIRHEREKDLLSLSSKSIASATGSTAASFPIVKALSKLNDEQLEKLKCLFNTAYAVVKHGKPFSDFELMCRVQLKNGLKLGENYLNRQGRTEFLKSIAESMMEKTKDEIKSCDFISIMSDGSTDKAILEQELVYVRYISPDMVPVTKIIQIVHLESGTAESIFNAIATALSNINIQVTSLGPEEKDTPSLVSVNFDGASVNFGKKSGVATKFQQVLPGTIALHCIAHKLELAVLDANKSVSYMNSFEQTVKGIFMFYHYSPKRRRELKEISAIFEQDLVHFSSVKQVRWLASKSRAVQALANNLQCVVGHLEHDATSGTRADDASKAKGYLNQICSVQFIRMLYFMLDYLPIVRELSLNFQTEDILVIELPDLIEKALVKLAAMKLSAGKNMQKFANLYDSKERKFGNVTLKTKNCTEFVYQNVPEIMTLLDNTIAYIKSRFSNLNESPINLLQIFNFHRWPIATEDLAIHGNEEVKDLMYSSQTGSFFSEEEKECIVSNDWPALKMHLRHMRNNPLIAVYPLVLNNTQFKESFIAKLIRYMMTISSCTAACERGFSKMNIIKNNLRSTLTQINMQHQLLVMNDGPELFDFDPEPAINHWLSSSSLSRHFAGHKVHTKDREQDTEHSRLSLSAK